MFCINLDPCTWSSREIQFSPFLDCYAKPIIEAMLAAKSESTLGQPHMDKKSFEDKNGKFNFFLSYFKWTGRERNQTKPVYNAETRPGWWEGGGYSRLVSDNTMVKARMDETGRRPMLWHSWSSRARPSLASWLGGSTLTTTISRCGLSSVHAQQSSGGVGGAALHLRLQHPGLPRAGGGCRASHPVLDLWF